MTTRDHKAIYRARKAKAAAEGTTVYGKRKATASPVHDLGSGEQTSLLPAAEPIFGTTVLAIPDGTTIDEWSELGAQLRQALSSTPWWVGDWLEFARTHYETDQAGNALSTGTAAVNRYLAQLGYEPELTIRYQRVAAKFRPSSRHEDLSWNHHLEVAPLDESDAHRLLNEATVEAWSTRELREHVRRLQAIDTTGQEALPGLGKPMRLTVRFGAGVIGDPAVLEQAATRIGQVLEELGLDGEVKVA